MKQIETSDQFFWHRLRSHVVAGALPTGCRSLLDLGAGAGILGSHLAIALPQVRYHFVEPLPSLRDHLRARFGHERDAADMESYEAFDAIALLDVLEHQDDDRAFLDGIIAKMRPGATLVLTVPALNFLWSHWDVVLGHRRRYSRKTLGQATSREDCDLIRLQYLFPELVLPGYLRKLKGSQGSAGEEFPTLAPWLNGALYWAGRTSLLMGPLTPVGSSLLAVLKKR